MSTITLPYDINNGDALDADKVMANEDAIVSEYNASVASKSGDVMSTTETQTATNKTLSTGTKILVGSDATGDIWYNGGSGAVTRLAKGTAGQVLRMNSGATAPEWGGAGRAFAWYLDGTSIVADEVGAKYIVPQNMTVSKIMAKTVSGTATIRIQKNTSDVDAGISVTSTVASETTITSAGLTAGEVLTLDITAASSCVGLTVTVECLQA